MSSLVPTERLYWADDNVLETDAHIVDVRENAFLPDRTCFYAGGGGQPSDQGTVTIGSNTLRVIGIETSEGRLWHVCDSASEKSWIGSSARLSVDEPRRTALSRYHTVLHIVNTIAIRDFGAWITGAQINTDYARIDFKWDGFSPVVRDQIEERVNGVISGNHALRASWLSEAEFNSRPELLRTLEVKPPVIDGRVRIVEIENFDAQACGGTHVHSTQALGRFRITKTENKGKINKRLYVELTAAAYAAADQ